MTGTEMGVHPILEVSPENWSEMICTPGFWLQIDMDHRESRQKEGLVGDGEG